MAKKNRYDDEFSELMGYVETYADEKGSTVKINSPDGLKKLLFKFNEREVAKGKKARFSKKYIDGVADSRKAQTTLPKVFGRFRGGFSEGTDYGIAGENKEKLEDQKMKVARERAKAEGKSLYVYKKGDEEGVAYRAVVKRKSGIVYQFRTEEGKFIGKRFITEET